jgi:hypothetical protein
MITREEYFYLLVISKQTVKLFKGDAFGMQIVPVDLPQGIEEVKRISGLDATTYRRENQADGHLLQLYQASLTAAAAVTLKIKII